MLAACSAHYPFSLPLSSYPFIFFLHPSYPFLFPSRRLSAFPVSSTQKHFPMCFCCVLFFFSLTVRACVVWGWAVPSMRPSRACRSGHGETWRFVGHSSHGSLCGSKLLNGDDQLNATRTDSRRERSWTTLLSTLNYYWNAERCCILWGMDWNGMIPNLEDLAPRMIEKVDL